MKILLTNDDGIHSKGLQVLVEGLSKIAEIWVVAPNREQSAKSHSFSMHQPLLVEKKSAKVITVDGTPADCAYIGLHLFQEKFDFVISGINHGANLGTDVHYSGTVAAAREACLQGVRSLAVSMALRKQGRPNFRNAVEVVKQNLPKFLELPADGSYFLNLNVPDLDTFPVVRKATLGRRYYRSLFQQLSSPRGQQFCWIGGDIESEVGGKESDVYLYANGFATLSPIAIDVTATSVFHSKNWTDL